MEIRIDGNALRRALRYDLAKLRCSACGEIFTAGLPAEVSAEKYSAWARALLAVSRYALDLPGYRLQGYQAMLGVPVPDATQWDQIEVVGDCAYTVVDEAQLIRCRCLAHGRRKFSEGEAVFPQECQVVLDVLRQVFDHDEHACEEQLSPEARLAYH